MSLPQQSYLINLLSPNYIADHTDPGSFHKGSTIDPAAISGHTVTDKSIKAFVQGSTIHPYEVHIKLVEGVPITYCSCPVQHQWCKHCVAVGLRSIALFQAPEDRFLENFVETASPSEIVSAFRKIFQWEPQVQLPLQLHVLAHTGTTVSISEFLEDHLGKAIGSFLPPRWTENNSPSGAGAHASLKPGVGKREHTARFEEMMVIFRHFLDHGHTELMLPYLEEFIKQLATNRTLSLAGCEAAKNTLNDALALHLSAAKAVVNLPNAHAGADIARWITWTYFFSEDIAPRLPVYAAEEALGQTGIDYCVNFAFLAEGYYGKEHPRLWPYLRDVISIAAPPQASAITAYAESLGLPGNNTDAAADEVSGGC